MGGGQRVNLAGVVGPIGEQHNNPALGFRIAQHVGPIGQPQANGRAAIQADVPGNLGFIQHPLQHFVIKRGRHLAKGLGGKNNQANPVVIALLNKLADDPFGRANTVWLKIKGGHTARNIQDNSDVYPLAHNNFAGAAGLGPGQGDNQQHQGCPTQHGQNKAHPLPPRGRGRHGQTHIGILHGGRLPPLTRPQRPYG